MQQRTPEWFNIRLGHVTGSRVADVLATIKSGESASRRNYRAQLVVERLTGASAEDVYINADMQRGIDHEPIARELYEARTGNLMDEVAFVKHPRMAWVGASPDGISGKMGVEFKCPRPATHIEYLKGGAVPSEYVPQVAMVCACAELDTIDFVSYCHVMPPKLRLFVVTWKRDQAYIDMIEEKVAKFLEEVAKEVETLQSMC